MSWVEDVERNVEYLGTAKAAQWLAKMGFRVSAATLRQWRWRGCGPPFHKLTAGGEAYYLIADLERFVDRAYSNTGEVAAGHGEVRS
jgi:hypothetical protein